MKRRFAAILAVLLLSPAAKATTFQVDQRRGTDSNPGTGSAPFRTIQHAADLAQPGDVITVHAGIYRERVSPTRGGTSDAMRIIYQAAIGERVVITGSEDVKHWAKVQGDVWKTTIPNAFFGQFNPYADVLQGDWFNPLGRQHHTGAVYLNGAWLAEADSLDELIRPVAKDARWFSRVDNDTTIIWAKFEGVNPNRQRVEINVRRTVFYPEKAGINFITVRGFTLENAATPWAPPTAEQIGLIGPHWSKGWIIENNVIRNSICSGISLGKYGDKWDNTSATAEGYVATIQRALSNGWSKDNIGHHIVRNNVIYNCGQAGIVGSLGVAFSTITGNTIHDIYVRRDFAGYEMAGIKFHGAIDVEISRNHIYRSPFGLWLDWMAQGTNVSQNLFHDNDSDIFFEVDHGPFLAANNLLLSPVSLTDNSQGGAYVHNLFAGTVVRLKYDGRLTPLLKPHSTELVGLHDNPPGGDRYYNNLFVKRADLSVYDAAPLPMAMDGNVYFDGAKPSKFDKDVIVAPDVDPHLNLVSGADGTDLGISFDPKRLSEQSRKEVTTALLGNASIPDLPYEQQDGSPICVCTDYFGKPRSESNPTPGPFESPGDGNLNLNVERAGTSTTGGSSKAK